MGERSIFFDPSPGELFEYISELWNASHVHLQTEQLETFAHDQISRRLLCSLRRYLCGRENPGADLSSNRRSGTAKHRDRQRIQRGLTCNLRRVRNKLLLCSYLGHHVRDGRETYLRRKVVPQFIGCTKLKRHFSMPCISKNSSHTFHCPVFTFTQGFAHRIHWVKVI